MSTPAGRVPLRIKLFHGLGMTAYGVKDNGFSTFLLLFYNQVVGMDATIVSTALALALVIDAFADPIIGYLSDRTYTRWGRRLPWLYVAPIPLALAWMLLWMPPISWGDNLFYYLLGVGILVRTLLSCCEVPSVSLVPELTSDYDERTTVMRYRYLFSWAGGLLMLFLAYDVFLKPQEGQKIGLLNAEGYWYYGLFGALLMAATVLISARGLHSRIAKWPDQRPEAGGVSLAFREIKESLSHRAFLILIGAGAIALTATQMTYVVFNYLATYVWQFGQADFAIYPVFLFGSVVIAFFLVAPVNTALGKRGAAIGMGCLSVLVSVTPYVLRHFDLWPQIGTPLSTRAVFGFLFVGNVLAIVATISMTSMLADIVEASEEQTGRRTEGVFFAGWFFVQKCATGVGILLTGLLLSYADFPKKAVPGQVAEPVLDTLALSYCAIVVVAVICSSLIFSRFPISRTDHEARVKALAERQVTG